jgi:hypothetical protein
MRYSVSDIGYILVSVALAAASGLGTGEPYKRAGVWFFGLCALVFVVQPWMRRRPSSIPAANAPANVATNERVEFDEQELRRFMRNGTKESIRWDELHEIGIVTTDEGPWAEDVFWLFLNADRSKGCAVPNGADGFPALLERIQTLPGFNNEAVVQAMGSAENNQFLIWRAESEKRAEAAT